MQCAAVYSLCAWLSLYSWCYIALFVCTCVPTAGASAASQSSRRSRRRPWGAVTGCRDDRQKGQAGAEVEGRTPQVRAEAGERRNQVGCFSLHRTEFVHVGTTVSDRRGCWFIIEQRYLLVMLKGRPGGQYLWRSQAGAQARLNLQRVFSASWQLQRIRERVMY